ncbi:hypothetical protein [Listeria ivanovii]|uniref:hypothetical protein n=1 Tax=Listeria ivanovii TaxID=1638 RepID=UPI0019425555|nr:hypothetical protein [Listeria ivanovii]MBM5721613.1 hypothetical protein [Listeria ivanovii]
MSLKKIIVLMALAALFLSFEVVADAETENATLAANEAVVTTFDELKKAISENNGIDTVYLGADIPLSSGIKIPDAKKTFTLSGKNPVTNEIHTLTETMASAGAQSSVITVDTNNGAKETTLKDINIIGKNYYGTISVLGAAKNVVQNYENIHYQGPQLIYNLNGVAVFSGDNDIRIASVVSGSAAANEVGEVKGVNVFGKLKIDHANSNANSVFWFGSGTAELNTFTVEENADVTILSNGTGMFYRSGAKPIDIDVKKNAKLAISSNNNIFRDTVGGTVNVAVGADVTITKTAGINPLLWMSGDINVNPDVRFILKKTGGTGNILYFSTATAKLDVQNPRSFLIATTPDNAMLYWPYANTFNFETQMVNYWNTAGTIDRTDAPQQSFSLPAGDNVIGSLTYSGTTTKIVSTNVDMTAANFNQNTARMIAMGRLEGTINSVNDSDANISGMATLDAYITVSYTENGVDKQLKGQADKTGNYQIMIPDGFIRPYTDLTTTISQDQRTITLEKATVADVTPPSGKPVPQVLTIGDPFPDVADLVTDVYDHSDNTSGAGIIKTLQTTPDTNVFGPQQAIVRLEDKANNYVDIIVPVFIKDDKTNIQDNKALRATDFSIHLSEISSLNEAELSELIIKESSAKAFNVTTGVDLSDEVIVANTDIEKTSGMFKATLQIGELTKEITIQVTGELKFNQVPETISFETTELATQQNIAKRNADFDMSVLDSRGAGKSFRVTARIPSPLTSTINSAHTLPEGLIFIDRSGEKKILSEEPTTVFEAQATDEIIVPIKWEENQGVLVEANTAETYADENYETTIEWTLTDAP